MNNKILSLAITGILLSAPCISFAQAPALGTAASFVLFTSNGAVGNTGSSHLTGNVGTNNGSSTGFGNVNGTMHNNNGATAAAAADLLTAYTQADTISADSLLAPLLGNGTILPAGVYEIAGNTVLNLALTLDAGGDANALFIFQISGTLSTNTLSEIILLNGAQACNIFWTVEGAVDMAAGTKMKGNVIANNAAISMATDTELEGRALSTTGAISVSGILAYTPVGCNSPLHTGPMAPTLGAVAGYAIFSGNGGVVNSGISVVTGEVGTNVGLTTGYDSLTVSCDIHPIPDTSTASASAALIGAATYLNGLAADIELLYPAQFGNSLVLTPHTYIMNGAVSFTDSLYLNAEGDSNAIFVIKTYGAFATSTFAVVALINGAKAENVYWYVSGALTINDYAKMAGTFIVDNGAIIVSTGAEINGRVLTTDGAVSTFAISTTMSSIPCNSSGTPPVVTPGDTLTVDQTSPVTPTNFTSIEDAVDYLNNTGVTEPTVVNVVPGTGPYNEQIVLGQIPGASPTNTVVLNGNGNTVNFCSTSPSNRDIIRLDGTDYITVENFVLNATCTYAWGVHLLNGNEGVTISNNTINLSAAYSVFAGNMQGIIAGNSPTDPAAMAGVLSEITISENTITNGYHGIRINGNTTTEAENVIISDNILNGTTMFGVLLSYAENTTVNGNTVSMKNVAPTQDLQSMGIYLVYIENGISVQGNTVTNAGNQGIFLNYINRTGTTRGTIANNMIGGGFRIANLALGLQINMSNYLDVYYNSVNVDNGTTGIALYVPNAHSTFLRVQNNSFAYTGNGTGGRALHANDASYNFETLNHNNYYSTGGEFVYYNRGFRANLAALQASVANGVAPHDANSMSANPMYMSSTNLHLNPLSPLANNAMAITSVTTDIDGDQRDTTPTIGADELSVPQPRMAKTETALTVYPNPFTDKLSVQVEQTEGTVQVVITDMTGRTVFTSTPVVSSGIVAVRPLNLLQGVYILQVTQTTGTTQSRIVKQ